MRKFCNFLLCLALVLALAAPVLADGDGLKVHNATAKKGQTVYMTVELTESVIGNAMAVEYTYNSRHLKPIPESCSWARTALIQDFDSRGEVGVWAVENSEDLKGGVCVLAFQVKTLAFFQQTEVACTVSVRGDDQQNKTFTATGKVIMDCEHNYGEWVDGGNLGHYRLCSNCGGKNTQNHELDEGVPMKDLDDPTLTVTVYTCKVCGGTQEHKGDGEQPYDPTEEGNKPSTLKPESTEDEKKPSTLKPESSDTQEGSGQSNQQQGSTGSEQSGQSEATGATLPQEVLDALMGDHEGHDHSQQEATPKNYTGPAIAVAVTLILLVGGMVIFIKRKR